MKIFIINNNTGGVINLFIMKMEEEEIDRKGWKFWQMGKTIWTLDLISV